MSRLGLRARLQLAVGLGIAVALIFIVAGFNLILARVLDHNASGLVRARAVAQIDSLSTSGGRLVLHEAPDKHAADAYFWIFAGHRALEEPRAAPSVEHAARQLAGGPAGFVTIADSDTRLYAAPVLSQGARIGTVVAGVSLRPYEDTRRVALLASIVLGGIVLLVVLLASRWLIDASLRPVTQMTRQAAEWSERSLDQRFALGPPHDELTELAATLDSLLDRLAASFRHERRFSAELSHELRTPLARVLAESELALRRRRAPDEYRESLELIRRNASQLSRTIDTLVAAARYEANGRRGTADAHEVAEEAVRACSSLAEERSVSLHVSGDGRLRVGVDAELAERILQPVLENACRYGRTQIDVRIGRDGAGVVYAIDDDGPGVGEDEGERIFEPGVRGSAPDGDAHGGAGLGLALARRLARTVDGDVVAEPRPDGGRFLIRLPTG